LGNIRSKEGIGSRTPLTRGGFRSGVVPEKGGALGRMPGKSYGGLNGLNETEGVGRAFG